MQSMGVWFVWPNARWPLLPCSRLHSAHQRGRKDKLFVHFPGILHDILHLRIPLPDVVAGLRKHWCVYSRQASFGGQWQEQELGVPSLNPLAKSFQNFSSFASCSLQVQPWPFLAQTSLIPACACFALPVDLLISPALSNVASSRPPFLSDGVVFTPYCRSFEAELNWRRGAH